MGEPGRQEKGGDPLRIAQIVNTLLKNAIDAMERSPEKRLGLKTCFENGAISIKIFDTGEGTTFIVRIPVESRIS